MVVSTKVSFTEKTSFIKKKKKKTKKKKKKKKKREKKNNNKKQKNPYLPYLTFLEC